MSDNATCQGSTASQTDQNHILSRRTQGNNAAVKIAPKYLPGLVLACLLSPGTLLFAQQAPDIFSGSRDVLYAESPLLGSINESWFAPLSSSGTRDSLNGHWFQQYARSVSELRRWSDSDRFMAPYVGHPLEGSIFGYIERQNDPQYRFVQWGDGREYWISMFRSMGFVIA